MLPDTMGHKHIVSPSLTKSHQNIKQNDENMDLFFITPISIQLVKTY